MTLTKADLAKSVRENVHIKNRKRKGQQFLFPELDYSLLPKKRATQIVDTTFEIIKQALEQGDTILITGFGKFRVKFKWARKGRNPQTGESIILQSHRKVTFHCSPKFKKELNKA